MQSKMPSAQSYQASIVIPAHNEAQTIRRLLRHLVGQTTTPDFEIVVVCNGCTDDTAAIARAVGAQVAEIGEPSKYLAMRRGDQLVSSFPRFYIDADVEIEAVDLREIVAVLSSAGTLAAAPSRLIPHGNTGILVRAYYDIWERLPQVQSGLFGRGVIGLSEAGYARTKNLPRFMSDDLAISEYFAPHERQVVPTARVVVRPPNTIRDLIRRRVRVATGNTELDHANGRSPAARTTLADLARIGLREPRMIPRLAAFMSVTMVARLSARRRVRSGDFQTWLRDESSRQD